MKAGFGTADITPAVPCLKLGWLRQVRATRVADPLYARAMVLDGDGGRAVFLALDTLSIRHAQVARIRERVTAATGIPGDRVLVAATHNHAGPAVARAGDTLRDEAYLAILVDRAVEAVAAAVAGLRDAEVGFGRAVETGIAHNRRVVYRDGIVRTHGPLAHLDALFTEGPIDPVVAVLAARDLAGKPLGCLVNFAMHPTFHGDSDAISANWPGVMVDRLGDAGWPVPVFLQGAMGNIATTPPGVPDAMDATGATMAAAALRALDTVAWRPAMDIRSAVETVQLPFRDPSPDQVAGTVRGAQRFIDPAIYDRDMPRLVAKIRARGTQVASVQAVRVGDHAFVAIPGELFVELGLAIKERAFPVQVHVAGCANGMVGYVPTRAAFPRGGYETTFAATSKLAPEAGDLLVEAALRAVRQAATGWGKPRAAAV